MTLEDDIDRCRSVINRMLEAGQDPPPSLFAEMSSLLQQRRDDRWAKHRAQFHHNLQPAVDKLRQGWIEHTDTLLISVLTELFGGVPLEETIRNSLSKVIRADGVTEFFWDFGPTRGKVSILAVEPPLPRRTYGNGPCFPL